MTAPSIDQRKLIANKEGDSVPGLGLSVLAQSYIYDPANPPKNPYSNNGQALNVVWDEERGWVNQAYNLIYNRDEQMNGVGGNNSYWLANHADPNQRHRVRWDTRTGLEGWYWMDPLTNDWITDGQGKRWLWDGSTFILV